MIAIPDEYYVGLLSREGLNPSENGFDRRAYQDRLARLQQKVEADVEQTVAGLAGAAVAEIDVRSMIGPDTSGPTSDSSLWGSRDAVQHGLLIAVVVLVAGVIVIRSRPRKPLPPRRTEGDVETPAAGSEATSTMQTEPSGQLIWKNWSIGIQIEPRQFSVIGWDHRTGNSPVHAGESE